MVVGFCPLAKPLFCGLMKRVYALTEQAHNRPLFSRVYRLELYHGAGDQHVSVERM